MDDLKENLFWGLIITVVVILCGILIYTMNEEYKECIDELSITNPEEASVVVEEMCMEMVYD